MENSGSDVNAGAAEPLVHHVELGARRVAKDDEVAQLRIAGLMPR
jgi:hypothetical protein